MKEKTAYCSLTYLQMFTPQELGLPEDCAREELEEAAEEKMKSIIAKIESVGYYHNDLEISIA